MRHSRQILIRPLLLSSPASIPPRIPHHHHAILYLHRESRRRLEGGGTQGITGSDREACAVARTDDFIAFDRAARQHAAVVRADIFDGVVLTVDVEDSDRCAVDIDDPMTAGRKRLRGSDANPFAHAGMDRRRAFKFWLLH